MALHMRPSHHGEDAKKSEHVQDQQHVGERADIGEKHKAEKREQRPDIDVEPVAPELDLPALRERVGDRVQAAPARRPLHGELLSNLLGSAAIDR